MLAVAGTIAGDQKGRVRRMAHVCRQASYQRAGAGLPSAQVRLRVPKEAGGGTSSQWKLIHCSSDTESKQGGCSMGASEGENG